MLSSVWQLVYNVWRSVYYQRNGREGNVMAAMYRGEISSWQWYRGSINGETSCRQRNNRMCMA